ncbi:glycoside hydrolase family 15 protein [Paraburkholderia tagetis]|uniref:Glycoside hydrolase family 15 protein n=1 Tax=Paraburkholderia tagetis TaxID=2913261 RepID=A0A9X1UD73_9BURK|nr:glycoside hydrolase family 15 protein [Paraburkholderia tagetis]MCG5072324.1 glycoside hydrolase family 15 protein [Paraburkholderia tagetis]
MSHRIEDYALLADGRGAALVSREGTIDWLCWPRFDSEPSFAAMLGTSENGHWRIAPAEPAHSIGRRYEEDTLVLQTDFECRGGCVRLTDFMAVDTPEPCIVRMAEGLHGSVPMRSVLYPRADADAPPPVIVPERGAVTVRTPSGAMTLRADVPLAVHAHALEASFVLRAGTRAVFMLCHGEQPGVDTTAAPLALQDTRRHWRRWIDGFDDSRTHWPQPVRRSLLTLKALIYRPSGAMVAAPTTSLPEAPGGSMNWDYRYCWLRDASFALEALIEAGFHGEALAWRDWLLDTLGETLDTFHVMYCVDGGHVPRERNVSALTGWRGARPVRIGNAAATQYQPDVFGEALDCLYLARKAGIPPVEGEAALEARIVRWLLDHRRRTGSGIWESRTTPCHFTSSRVMAWVALDRFISHWRDAGPGRGDALMQQAIALRRALHDEVCTHGWHAERGVFVRGYADRALDASVLLMPLVGFMRADDPRMSATLDAIRAELGDGGLIRRWKRGGEAPDEGAFLACSCWMADCLYLRGDEDAACRQFERVLAVANDLGLLAEEYDVQERRLAGNFPQALTHMAVVKTALLLSGTAKRHRSAAAH